VTASGQPWAKIRVIRAVSSRASAPAISRGRDPHTTEAGQAARRHTALADTCCRVRAEMPRRSKIGHLCADSHPHNRIRHEGHGRRRQPSATARRRSRQRVRRRPRRVGRRKSTNTPITHQRAVLIGKQIRKAREGTAVGGVTGHYRLRAAVSAGNLCLLAADAAQIRLGVNNTSALFHKYGTTEQIPRQL